MKKLVLAASVAALLSTSVQADTLLGLYIGGQVWDSAATGTFGQLVDPTDTVSDFNFNDEQQTNFFVALEHPIPLIPNIKIASTTLATDGQTMLSADITFGDVTFSEDVTVDMDFDVSFIDYTLYYEILDNDLMTFDIGLTARDFDGNVMVADANVDDSLLSENVDVAVVVPMVYVSAIVGLPFTGLNFFAEGNFTSYDDSSLYDYQVGVSYALLDNLAVDLDITLGYRSVKLDLEDIDDLYADMSFDGAYLGATVHF